MLLALVSCAQEAKEQRPAKRPLGPPVAIAERGPFEMVFALSGGWKPNSDKPVGLKLVIRNTSSKSVDFEYSSSKEYDFFVHNSKGKPVWRWSHEKVFTQVIIPAELKSGSKMVFESTWDKKANNGKPVPPGKYKIRAKFEGTRESKAIGPLSINIE